MAENDLTLFEDLICLTQLPVLTFKFLDAIPLGRGHAVALAGIRLMLLDPNARLSLLHPTFCEIDKSAADLLAYSLS